MELYVALNLALLLGVVDSQEFRPHFRPHYRPRFDGRGSWRSPCQLTDMYADCELQPNYLYFPPYHPSGLSGVVRFRQFVDTRDCSMGYLHVDITVESFPMFEGNPTSEHGIHVTSGGDLSQSCYSLGPHFNPYRSPHGAPWFPYYRRHVGDFGNVVRQSDGTIRATFTDNLASLYGPDSIISRGLVITERRDDLGMGEGEESLIDGNSGHPVACCVIKMV